MGYKSKTQEKNLAWFLPRPKKDRYRGGMPLYAEEWLIELAKDIIEKEDAKVLNLFCGMSMIGTRVDIKSEVNPDILCDAHKLSDHINETFDIILADPPYSTEEAKKLYNTPKLNYKKWSAEADKVLNKGGLLIVYHKYVMPNPDPTKYEVAKRVFIGNRTYHLARVAILFQKKLSKE
jgi:16S rRNA G966 N2-methylase RsmD